MMIVVMMRTRKEHAVYKVRAGGTRPYAVAVRIEKFKLYMEINAGTAVSVVLSKIWKKKGCFFTSYRLPCST